MIIVLKKHAHPHVSPYLDDTLLGLPDSMDLHKELAEKETPVEPQGPEEDFVILLPLEAVLRVSEDDVLSIYFVCMHGNRRSSCSSLCKQDHSQSRSLTNRLGMSSRSTRIASPTLAK